MKKTNNKGFNLVELIIVIAIMVILVAVVAPQYLKYVHNSRIGVDVQTAADLATSINVAVATGSTVFTSSGAVDWSKIDGISTMPASKFSTGTISITGTNTDGVTKITLTGVSNGASTPKTSYELYPNPENTTDGINQGYTGVGLKK